MLPCVIRRFGSFTICPWLWFFLTLWRKSVSFVWQLRHRPDCDLISFDLMALVCRSFLVLSCCDISDSSYHQWLFSLSKKKKAEGMLVYLISVGNGKLLWWRIRLWAILTLSPTRSVLQYYCPFINGTECSYLWINGIWWLKEEGLSW